MVVPLTNPFMVSGAFIISRQIAALFIEAAPAVAVTLGKAFLTFCAVHTKLSALHNEIAGREPARAERNVPMFQNFEETSKFGKEAMDNGLKSLAAMSKNMQAIAVEASEYSKKTFDNGSAAVERFFAAKSPEKAMEVQADYLKQAYEGFVAQAAKMGDLYAEMAKDAYKPFEQIVAKAK